MVEKRQYNGLDVTKAVLAVLVALRHMIQIFYPEESKWRLVIGAWLSNLAVPVFFITAGFFLFRKVDRQQPEAGRRAVLQYCGRIFRLYVLWSVIYLPIDYYNWIHGQDRDVGAAVLKYIQSFFFCSTTVQLWYLPALLIACFLVGAAYEKGIKIWKLLVIGGILFGMGCIGDNWYWNEQLPMKLQDLLRVYVRYFMTMRNGIFYGFFFVALGLWFAKTEQRIPFFPALVGSVLCVVMMLAEIRRCSNTNMVFMAAPAAFCIFGAASAIHLRDRKVYARLRGVSQWVYPFLCLDFKVEPPSGYKEGNHSVHFGANDSVCMGDGMYIGEKRGQMAEDACLGHYAVKVKGIPSWERCGRSVR